MKNLEMKLSRKIKYYSAENKISPEEYTILVAQLKAQLNEIPQDILEYLFKIKNFENYYTVKISKTKSNMYFFRIEILTKTFDNDEIVNVFA